jgi:nicotinamidase-related amidase
MKSALLVIDVQVGLVTGAYKETEVVTAINKTASWMRGRDNIVIFIQHCHSTYEPMQKGNPGWALHSGLDVQVGDLYVEKQASDSFYETNLSDLLKESNVNHLYITGLQTEYCIDTTCRSAISKGYSVTLVSDAHTTGDSHLPAEIIIDHHNKVLANLAHPKFEVKLKSSTDL